jgi:DNA polymerase-4
LLPDVAAIQKQEALESVRSRLRHFSVQRELMIDRRLSSLNPKEDHIIHPERFFSL